VLFASGLLANLFAKRSSYAPNVLLEIAPMTAAADMSALRVLLAWLRSMTALALS
jgi:hypothetical protein